MTNIELMEKALPTAPLKIAALESCKDLAEKVDQYIVSFRKNSLHDFLDPAIYSSYEADSYLAKNSCPRFGSGEAKGMFGESIRGKDLFIMVDVCNYSLTYSLCGYTNHMSPDDHFQDLKRVIAAIGGKARRINVIMPFLYESRQHKRSGRESLDCALALQELVNLGVDNIMTFDARDKRVQPAIPDGSFENIMPTYQMIKSLVNSVEDLHVDKDHLMVISPDEGAMHRAIYFANLLGVDVGMFYKRRDYSRVVDGRNPIVAHEFLGDSVEGKDVIIIDDMIASGESMLDVARQLKARKARRVYCLATFGLFTAGLDIFDQAKAEGTIEKVITTNLTYQDPELINHDWNESADMRKYIATLFDHQYHGAAISSLLDQSERIQSRIQEYKEFGTISDNYKAPTV